MVTIKKKNYLTARETAKKCGRSKAHIYSNYREWGWRRHTYGRNILFEETQVDEWLETQVLLLAEEGAAAKREERKEVSV